MNLVMHMNTLLPLSGFIASLELVSVLSVPQWFNETLSAVPYRGSVVWSNTWVSSIPSVCTVLRRAAKWLAASDEN
jgi:hypothetical protein